MSKKSNKPKKEKVTYIDDGRTVADMSNLPTRPYWSKSSTTSNVKDILSTFWSAFKMMLKPTLVAVGFLCVIFLIAYLWLWLA